MSKPAWPRHSRDRLCDRTVGKSRGRAIDLVPILAFVLMLWIGAPLEAGSVLIATGDGTGNTTPPADDPGFANVGIADALSGVYVGNGWVLTASHVGPDPIELQGVVYQPVPGSRVQFSLNGKNADLIAYKLLGADPPLPALAIADSPPTNGTSVTLIGHGRNRGTPTTYSGLDGWNWASGREMRWGTNRISDTNADQTYNLDTEAFATTFDQPRPNPPSGEHEADLVTGDSGGAAFTGGAGTSKLIGILFARVVLASQPSNTSIFTNEGLIVDLYAYRNDILSVIDQPECDDGLDDDGDGLVDYPDDPGCVDALDVDERGAAFACDNGLDDDGDSFIDYPDDPECPSAFYDSEAVRVPVSGVASTSLGVGLWAVAQLALRRRRAVHD